MTRVNIIHAPTEIAGQIGILCDGLRKKGHNASGYNWFQSYLKYSKNIINTDSYELVKFINVLDKYCDIVHFHNGNTFMIDNKDISFLCKDNKLVMHHWGNDVRTQEMIKKYNPYSLPKSYLSDEEIKKRLEYLSKYIDTAIVQDQEVYFYVKDYYKNVYVMPLACKVNGFKAIYPKIDNGNIKIIHAPTDREFKGSAYVEQAMRKLTEKRDVSYITIERMSHLEALQAYMEADIVIDQLLCGSYGMLSVEAMAMGKAVIAYIREDVRANLTSDVPIVNANPDNIYSVILNLVNDPKRIVELGHAGRQYVMKYHDIEVVTNQLCQIYEKL